MYIYVYTLLLKMTDNIVTCILIAWERLVKHSPAEANVRNIRTSIARQRNSKHLSLIITAIFSVVRAEGL
jgi:hypothetical protein